MPEIDEESYLHINYTMIQQFLSFKEEFSLFVTKMSITLRKPENVRGQFRSDSVVANLDQIVFVAILYPSLS